MNVKESRISHPQNMSLWQEGYFELKAVKTQQIQEKRFTSPQLPKFTLETGLYQEEGYYQRHFLTKEIYLNNKATRQPLFSKNILCLPENGLLPLYVLRSLPISLAQVLT